MNMPKVSVVLPVHNAAATLATTLESIQSQTEEDFEILVIDDGSTDESLRVAIRFAEGDSRIKVVSLTNGGVAAARNLGMSLARGQLIAFIDSDDLWLPEKLERHWAFHERNQQYSASYAAVAFIASDAVAVTSGGSVSSVSSMPLTLNELIGENPVCTMSNLVVTKSSLMAFGEFDTTMSFSEDQEWLARAVFGGMLIAGIDDVLVGYRMSPAGLSANLDAMFDGWQKIARKYGDVVRCRGAEAVYCRYLARRALRSGAPSSVALRYAWQGLRADSSVFLKDARRGWATLIAVLFSPILPRFARIHIFS